MTSKALKDVIEQDVSKALYTELGLSNVHEIPKITKIVVNVGFGDASNNAKLLEEAISTLTTVTGQKPMITRARKSIAGFKIREGMPIGGKVTLRGKRMYDFLAKLLGVVLPRIRDFRGLPDKAFDGRGNYNIGLTDQLIFPEIAYDQVSRARGFNITVVTTAKNDQDAKLLLSKIGFPFTKPVQKAS